MDELILPSRSVIRGMWPAGVYDGSIRPDPPTARYHPTGLAEFPANMVTPWQWLGQSRLAGLRLAGTGCQRLCLCLKFHYATGAARVQLHCPSPLGGRAERAQARPGGEEKAVCAER